MSTCSYCRGPIAGSGLAGRPRPAAPAATYCCYGCLDLGEHEPATPAGGWSPGGLGLRLGVGVLVVGQSMIFGLALNLHDDVPGSVRWAAQTIILAATLLVVALLGGPLVRTAWHELRRGRLTIEALFLLTLGGALAASVQAHVTGRGKVYFEVVSILLVVYTLGKAVGARSRAAALAGATAWAGRLRTCRLVAADGRTRTVPVAEVNPGDVIEVHPGEVVAVDGVIREGVGFLAEAAVTGEPFAVVRRPGDRVLAGVAAFDATFRVEATAPGTERQVDRLLAAVEEARDRPPSLRRQADRLGRVFLPLVAVAALGTFGYWTFLTPAGWEAGLFNAMSVLLVACPCAIGLATPVVVWSAVSRLAGRGLVVRAGDAVERLAAVDCVLLDKTGTLTDDRFAIVDIETAATGAARAELLGWVSLAEEHSGHPLAKPFAELPRPFAAGAGPRVTAFRAVPGCGVEAELVEANGARHEVRIGRPGWAGESISHQPDAPARASHVREGGSPSLARRAGESPTHTIAVAVDGRPAALATVAERLRDSTSQALADFHALGLPAEVLTGDTPVRAAALGLPARAGLLPDDKRARVAELIRGGRRPLMVGDGINDAAALAAAHAGVALASGTDLAVSAADATLYHGDLRVLPWAVALSRHALRAVRRNLWRAVAYNVVGMALAAGGVLHPVVAALLMVVSSLTLVFSATRVGSARIHCEGPRGGPGGTAAKRGARVHFAALALQFVPLLVLVAPHPFAIGALALGAAFVGVAAVTAYLWDRTPAVPHALDMAFGMLTLGNLGMLLGWGVDARLGPARSCACHDPLAAPGMWLGMLVFANVAMRWLGRRPLPRTGNHAAAMFTGGNLGMALGMAAGGWGAARLGLASAGGVVLSHFALMSLGMVAGMLAGTWLAEKLFDALGWLRSGVLADEVVRAEAEPDRDDRVPDVLRR